MLHSLKRRLYFVVATYFAFWAKFVLRRWQPRIVIVTGSSGKTSTLHLIEAQLGDKAVYSHHANGAIGLPFHILGMPTNVRARWQWLFRFVWAPFMVFRRIPQQKIYIAEADCDRPHEGKFIARFLKPEVTLWVSVSNTHSMNFDKLVKAGAFKSTLEAIAYEFGNFIAYAQKLVIVNSDQPEIVDQLDRVPKTTHVERVAMDKLKDYKLDKDKTIFELEGQTIEVPGLQPTYSALSLQLVNALLKYLGEPVDKTYHKLQTPPGRSSLFKGKKDTLLIDSTYNTGLGATAAIFTIFAAYPSKHKWLVMGDILEQGKVEQSEHEKLAEAIAKLAPERVVLLGHRTHTYTYPTLQKLMSPDRVVSYESPKEVLDYLQEQLSAGEVVLFKGAQGLEGVIEQLLANPSDARQLVRREPVWVKRRQAWGLPG